MLLNDWIPRSRLTVVVILFFLFLLWFIAWVSVQLLIIWLFEGILFRGLLAKFGSSKSCSFNRVLLILLPLKFLSPHLHLCFKVRLLYLMFLIGILLSIRLLIMDGWLIVHGFLQLDWLWWRLGCSFAELAQRPWNSSWLHLWIGYKI